MFLLVVIGLLLIIASIQLRRGRWYGIIAGNTFKDKPIEEQKKGAKGASSIGFFIGGFLIIEYILNLFKIETKYFTLLFVLPVSIYSFYGIYKYLKHYIKYGE